MQGKLKLLEELSYILRLNFETQDWGIINADSERVMEFIHYFNSTLDDFMHYELAELIIASLNEAILADEKHLLLKPNFMQFIDSIADKELFTPILDYWRNLKGYDEFPVGELL